MDTGEPIYKAKMIVFGCGEKGKEVRAIIWKLKKLPIIP
jgi:hypothetical protein